MHQPVSVRLHCHNVNVLLSSLGLEVYFFVRVVDYTVSVQVMVK